MKYQCVIFDLDGTILNTIDDLTCACNQALRQYGLKEINSKQTKAFLGHGIRHLMLEASNNDPRIDDLLAIFRKYYNSNYNVYTKEYEGITEVFEWCISHHIQIGVYTNKVEDIAIRLCQEHFQNRLSFVYGEVKGRSRKPDATFLTDLIRKLGLTPSEVLYIGDSEVDVQTAQSAGTDGLFVSYGFRDKEQMLAITNQLVDDPKEIITYLKTNIYNN